MSWMVHTGCRYHTQDTGYYCSAASAMMILAEIGVDYANLDQDDLYNLIHNNNAQSTGWYGDAYGLRHALVDQKPATFNRTFVVRKPTSEAEGSKDIVYTLHKYEVSPAVLVYGCAHWIVVPGVQTDVEPVSGATYTIDGFWINNPIHEDNEPHSATDVCGSGGAHGTANEFVTYADWQATFLTGCNYDDPGGNDQYISVCDPDVRDIELPQRRARVFLADGRRLLEHAQTVEFAQRGIEEYGLLKDKRVARILDGAKPGDPLPVLRLDQPNTYYFLVPWEVRGGVVALARVDARFGTFAGIRLLERPIEQEMLTREMVMKKIVGIRFDLPERLGRLKILPEVACLAPTLVWKPCWESWSPNLPFFQFTIGEHVLYVRVDGEVFAQLTTTGKGT